jgi:hypothetical protein
MPRLPNKPDRDFSARPSDNEIDVDIAGLFTSQPPEVDESFADPIVRMRIGLLITRAMNESKSPRRRNKSS